MTDAITLNDGVRIPVVGFGTFRIPADESTYKAVRSALDSGYRHIDTAMAYYNEEEVGRAVKEAAFHARRYSSPRSCGFLISARKGRGLASSVR